MGRARSLVSLAWRESRTARRRLLLYMSSISLGVAALVAIDSFSENVTRSVHDQARSLLGGDIALRSRDPYPTKVMATLDSLAHTGLRLTQSTTFASMALVARSGATRLAQVHAIAPAYPFYGDITSEPALAWPNLQRDRNVIVDPSLLISLGARLGDTLALGTGRFVITGTLKSVPGDAGISATIGPRIYIPDKYLVETGLLVFGSRAEYETLVKLPTSMTPAQFERRMREPLVGSAVRIRTVAQNESNLTQAIDHLRDFLSVVSLVSLLLGGIGVASGVHAFVMRKIDTVAVLRCLGATSWQVLAIYVAQAAAMGLIGALAGTALGVGIQFLFPRFVSDFLPVDVHVTLELSALALGVLVGVWVSLVFALRPLVAVRRVSPLQALRRESDADALRRGRGDPLRLAVSGAIVASIVLLSIGRSGNVSRGFSFSIAIMVAVAALWTSALLLSLAARRFVRPRWSYALRQGVANLYRPGNQTRAVVLALGFGVFLMSTLYQVQHSLLHALGLRLEQARANVVFYDIQEDQVAGLDSVIRTSGFPLFDQTPIVPMRLGSIGHQSVAELLADSAGAGRRRPGWALRREYRSTFRDTLVSSEKIVAGRWFGATSDTMPELSVERDVARELGVTVGDTLTWNVQGVKVATRVTSLRQVDWASFEPNFFAVFSPRALEHAPKQFVVLTLAPRPTDVARLQRRVVSRFPNVSSLDLSLVQRTITSVLDKVTTAIRFMALISLALGIPVLFSAVAATRRERLREGVLLKTLGATRRQIGRIMLAEYALLGAMGSLMGVLLSVAGAWALLHWIFRLAYVPSVLPALVVALVMTALAVVIGLLTGREVFSETPMAALREA